MAEGAHGKALTRSPMIKSALTLLYVLGQKVLDPFRAEEDRGFDAYTPMKTFAQKLVEIAAAEDGVEEVNGSNCGPRVDEYKAATWLDPKKGWPWCAAFVCWIVREAMFATGAKENATFKRPRTAGAWDLRNWSLAQDMTTRTKDTPGRDIEPGDIIGYTFSHCGIAATAPDKEGHFWCWEGNTDAAGSREGGGVFKKRRHTSKVRFRIRFSL